MDELEAAVCAMVADPSDGLFTAGCGRRVVPFRTLNIQPS